MKKIIISDTTTLIVLERQQHLFLLCKLFEQVIIPVAVYEELLVGLKNDNPLKNIECITIEPVVSSSQLNNLLTILDKGEAEAIELAVKKQLPLIIDERKGRKIAQRLGLVITGLAGLLILAVERNILNSKQAKNLLNMAVQDGYRLSKLLHDQVNKILSS
jgi:predicted nucleic acid-binding protein